MATKQAKMTRKIKNEWVKALRSGDYEQGESVLYDKQTNSYCCLGVLARVCGVRASKLHGFSITPAIGESKEEVMNYNVLASNKVPALPMKQRDKLTDMNDGNCTKQRSFKYIASYIDRCVKVER